MSHIVIIQTEVRDPAAIEAACQRLRLPPPQHGSFQLYSAEVTGVAIQLPDWRYPVVAETHSGTLRYDNFGGHWGQKFHLDRFLQAYAVERARLEARKQGHTTSEQLLADGSIKLTIQVTGGAL